MLDASSEEDCGVMQVPSDKLAPNLAMEPLAVATDMLINRQQSKLPLPSEREAVWVDGDQVQELAAYCMV